MSQFIGSIQDVRDAINASQQTFLKSEANKKAREDFKYLCGQLRYRALDNVNYQSVSLMETKLCDALVVAWDMSKGQVWFPKGLVDFNHPKLFVAVVAYDKGAPQDIYMFRSTELTKTGLFSMYKYDKRHGALGIAMPKGDKLRQYSFGYVIKKLEGEK